MPTAPRFQPIRVPEECERLRTRVAAGLAEHSAAGNFDPHKPNR